MVNFAEVVVATGHGAAVEMMRAYPPVLLIVGPPKLANPPDEAIEDGVTATLDPLFVTATMLTSTPVSRGPVGPAVTFTRIPGVMARLTA